LNLIILEIVFLTLYLDDLNSKLSGSGDQSMGIIMENISEGIKKLRFQTEQSQEDQGKELKKQFQELLNSITRTNEELKNSIDKLSVVVGESSKEVLPGIEQNMSQFSDDLGQTMIQATEKMSQSFEKKSTEADEAGKWQVRSVIELQELNNIMYIISFSVRSFQI
jgi:chorismate mutase